MRLDELGEFGIIAKLTAVLPEPPEGVLGPGDDAAVVPAPDGRVVATTDMLVEGRHFRRNWSSAADVGHKAAAQNLADVAAMGARPTALLVAIGAPGDLDAQWVIEFNQALSAEADRAGAGVVGGDLVGADQIVVSVTALGSLDGRAPVLRSGGQSGDVVAVSAPTGASAAGLAVLRRGFTAPRTAVAAHRRPMPDYEAGVVAAQAGAHALVDTSDGLVADLKHVATASGIAIDIDSGLVELPDPVRAVGAALNVDPLTLALTGGEDHVLAGLFAPQTVPVGWRSIGRAVEGSGVLVDGQAYELPGGHDHFGA
jgi:thiamine-monophosphate kinase